MGVMGDRYILSLQCNGCNKVNNDVYYAPACGFTSFECYYCGKTNKIGIMFTSVEGKQCEKKQT